MLIESRTVATPFFSICIPQYNRTSFLIEVCKSLAAQSFRNFEVCISDDCSTDGRGQELLDYLAGSGLSYVYQLQTQNLRYDGNLRASMHLAQGTYLFLLGNDDALKSTDTLAQLATTLQAHGEVGVVFTNYEDYASGQPYPRVFTETYYPGTPAVAARRFRNFAFVSGVLLHRAASFQQATTAWDGTEMYQMYIGCRLIASGLPLLELTQITIRKDVVIADEQVDSFVTNARAMQDIRKAQSIPFTKLIPLVVNAVVPYTTDGSLFARIIYTVFTIPYPLWLIEYRRVHSWGYAYNVAQGMHPRRTLKTVPLSWLYALLAHLLYYVVTFAGLTIPITLFAALRAPLHRLAKRL